MADSPDSGSAGEVEPDLSSEDQAWLRRLALRLTGDPHDAADLEQDTWVRLLRSPPPVGVRLRAWIATVMTNARRNEVRGQSRRRVREDAWQRTWRADREGVSEAGLEEPVAPVLELVRKLEENYRDVVFLSFMEQLSSGEIGERLGVPAATVRTWRRRALQKLRGEMDRRRRRDRAAWAPALVAWVSRWRERLSTGSTAGRIAVAWPAAAWSLILLSLPLTGVLLWSTPTGATTPSEVRVPLLIAPTSTERVDWQPPPSGILQPDRLLGRQVPTSDVPLAAPRVATVTKEPANLTVRIVDDASGALLPRGVVSFSSRGGQLKLEQADIDARPSFEGAIVRIPRSTIREQAVSEHRNLADVFIGAPGYAWVRQRWEVDAIEDLEVRLVPGASLSVTLTADPSVVEPRMRLRSIAGRAIRQARATPGPSRGSWSVRWDGLPIGQHRIELLMPEARPSLLDEWSIDLIAGESREIVLTSQAIAKVEPHAPLSVHLSLPSLGEEPPRISWRRLDAAAQNKGAESPALPVPAGPDNVADGLQEWHWSAGEVPLGEYGLAVLPHGLLLRSVVEESGAHLTADVSMLAIAEIRVQDAATGLAVEGLDKLSWRPVLDTSAHSAGVGLQPLVRRLSQPCRPDAAGRWMLSAAPGRVRISTGGASELGEQVWFGERVVQLSPGHQVITLVVQQLVALELLFEVEGHLFPFDVRSGHHVEVEHSAKTQGVIRDHLARRSSLAVSPGRVVLRFSDIEGFEPVSPIEVDVHVDTPQRVIVPLRRCE